MALTALGVAPPNLPIPTNEYSRIYHEQFSNVLRLFLNAVAFKLNTSEVVTADDIGPGTYNRFYTLSNQTITRNTDGTINVITHNTIADDETFLVQTYAYNSLGQVSSCVSVDTSTGLSVTTTETFSYTGDAITSVVVTVV